MTSQPLDIYFPETNRHPGAAGLYPYTFNAHPGNSGERLQTLANLAGLTIYATDLMGQETGEIFGVPARKALKPGEAFQATAARQAEALSDTDFYQHDVRIGLGDSLGVTSILGLQTSNQVPDLFSALQLRDGFNLRRFQSLPPVAYADYFMYQARDVYYKRKRQQNFMPQVFEPVSTASFISPHARDAASFLTKITSIGPLMQNREHSVVGMCIAAADVELPLNAVGFMNGLSGSRARLYEFFEALTEIRLLQEHIQSSLDSAAPIRCKIIPGWHSDILNPFLGAKHLRQTVSLIQDA